MTEDGGLYQNGKSLSRSTRTVEGTVGVTSTIG